MRPIIDEALGLTNDTSPYVYLSDGGHFENLGLYEMVLRRCHFILVSDAGQDPECSFADLGESVRKIRIDFGIPIDFGQMNIYPRSQIARKKRGHNCAIGRVRYSAVEVPLLLMASSFTSNRRVTGTSHATYTNTLRGAKHFRTRAPLTSFSPNRSSKAIGCLGRTRWRNSARIAAVISGASLVKSSGRTWTQPPDWLATLIQMSPTERDATGAN